MSVFQAGTRVVITFGLKQGCRGVIQGMHEANGVAVVTVLLEGDSVPQEFRPSVLMRDVQKSGREVRGTDCPASHQ